MKYASLCIMYCCVQLSVSAQNTPPVSLSDALEKIEIVKDHPSIWFDDIVIEHLEYLIEDDASYIRYRMDQYMEEKRNDMDEFTEIDDMLVANESLAHILERIKALAKKDEFLCYVPASITYDDEG